MAYYQEDSSFNQNDTFLDEDKFIVLSDIIDKEDINGIEYFIASALLDNNQLAEVAFDCCKTMEAATIKILTGMKLDSKSICRKISGMPLFTGLVSTGHYRLIYLALKNGADVNYSGEYETTPLQQAILSNRELNIIELLLEHGANLNVLMDRRSVISLYRYRNSRSCMGISEKQVNTFIELCTKYGLEEPY